MKKDWVGGSRRRFCSPWSKGGGAGARDEAPEMGSGGAASRRSKRRRRVGFGESVREGVI
jgi:hypothetical protein